MLAPGIEELLVCPTDRTPLVRDVDGRLACGGGHRYPVVEGVPVLLPEGVAGTIDAASASRKRAHGETAGDSRAPELHLESLGLADHEKAAIAQLWRAGPGGIDPVVQFLIAATCGIGYRESLGRLSRYPIPEFPLSLKPGSLLVDIGCNWGRWSFSAERAGHRVAGVDPQLGALLAARRVARDLGREVSFICADARYLPFADGRVDAVFSYSVLQHFSRADCVAAVREIGRVLRADGVSMVQMANALGLRSLQHLVRREFRETRAFEVRYYTPGQLIDLFASNVGPTSLTADSFLGLGLQASDLDILSPLARMAARISGVGRKVSAVIPPVARLADSVYLQSTKR